MKRAISVVAVLLVAAAFVWFLRRQDGNGASGYRFVTVERGDIESIVSSTGTLDAVTTVQVGTQVSGIIDKIFVDFNDEVHAGQVIALIDTTLLASSVRQAEADLERNEAQLRYAEREHERVRELHAQSLAAEKEFNAAQYELELARANTKAARVALEKAKQNLTYATILAPVSGTVIERNVDVGQTVAASFSAPQLFLIANDLARMQILAAVDESDIGAIEEGQLARFTVQAYPDEVFAGTVRQVRLQSTNEENVVNYTVVVDVANDDGRLLPGMTATVDFVTDRASDVLMVANAGLRFRATEEMMAELRARRQRENSGGPDTMRGEGSRRPTNAAMIFYLDADGKLAATRVRTGLSDGQKTVIEGADVQAGMEIIAGVGQAAQSNATNPFQSQQRQGPPRPPGVF